MDKLIEDFGLDTAEKWDALDKDFILTSILEAFSQTRKPISIDQDLPSAFGIYTFFIKPDEVYEDCESLNEVWNIEPFKKFPKIVKKRFEKCEAEDGWFPFYIGKSEKLGARINEHLKHHSTHATYGLKLKERTEFLKKNQIEVGYWILPEMEGVPREIRQFIITNLESRLREKMKPWIGKQ